MNEAESKLTSSPKLKASRFWRWLAIIMVVAVIIVAAWWPRSTAPKAASITAASPKTTAEHQITVPIDIDSGGNTINAAQVKLNYDASVVTSATVSKTGSIFNLWITGQPQVNPVAHQITFEGGVIRPGFKGHGQIGTVTLTAKQAATTTLHFSADTEILLADGKGTAVPLKIQPLVVKIP